ncbi:Nucleoid occlusion protein [subsurface metagenome]
MSKIIFVNLADLNLPEFQAHTKVPEAQLKEISESIKAVGVLEPLLVKKIDIGYEIIAGCLRYRATLIAGLKAAPCIVMHLDERQSEIIKLHENIKRIPLDHIDQATTFMMMMKEYHMTEQSVADSVGKSVAYISQHISLIRLGGVLSEEVKNGSISFSQARELMRIDDTEERNRLMLFCKNDGASVQVLHSWVQEHLRKPIPEPQSDDLLLKEIQHTESSELFRSCEACNKKVKMTEIRLVFYCPDCHIAIKTAIFEENQKSPPDSTDKTSESPPD